MENRFVYWAIVLLIAFVMLRIVLYPSQEESYRDQKITYKYPRHSVYHRVESIFHDDSGIYGRASYERHLYDKENQIQYPLSLTQPKEREEIGYYASESQPEEPEIEGRSPS